MTSGAIRVRGTFSTLGGPLRYLLIFVFSTLCFANTPPPPRGVRSVTAGTGLAGGVITDSGTISLSSPVPVNLGGTGETSASAALNSLLPDQTSHNGEYLMTNGSAAAWNSVTAGANTTLSNLGTTAINAHLNPATDASVSLGTTTERFLNVRAINYQGNELLTADGLSGSSQDLVLGTGQAFAGNSGKVYIRSGIASGAPGGFRFYNDGVSNAVGDVWTATSTQGDGYWAAPAGDFVKLDGSTPLTDDWDAGNHSIEADAGFYGDLFGNADTATYASGTTVSDDTTTNATVYPSWVTNTSGVLPQKVSSSKLSFNPSTGMLSATGVTSAFTANANVKLNGYYLSGDGGNEGIKVDNFGFVTIGNSTSSNAISAAAGSTSFSLNAGDTSASGTNTAGGVMSINGGLGTGTGLGEVAVWVPVLKASGTTAQDTLHRALSAYSAGTASSYVSVQDTLRVGTQGATTASVDLYGTTSGVVSVKPQDAAGTYNFNLPTTAGSSGQPLLSGGGGSSPHTYGTLGVAAGGTGLTAGTSGGIPYYSSTSAITSSGALTASQLILGGGAGASPTSLAAGSQYQVLRMGASNPAYGSINLDQSAAVTGALPIGNGGTGQATKAAAFDALSPMTTSGDIIYGGASGTGTRLAKGSNGDVLTLAAGIPSWAAPSGGSGTTYTANQYGVALSSATNATLTILAPDASQAKYLKSGGSSANPAWDAIDISTSDISGVLPQANGGIPTWYLSAKVTGGNPVLAFTTSATYKEIPAGSVFSGTLTPTSGSVAAGITCNLTSHAADPSTSATTCNSTGAAGDATKGTLGVSFNIGAPGIYEICFYAGWFGQAGGSAVLFQHTFGLVETPVNAQTATITGVNQVGFVYDAAANLHVGIQAAICEPFNWRSATTGDLKTVRLFYNQTITTTAANNAFLCDNGAGTTRQCTWTGKFISQ